MIKFYSEGGCVVTSLVALPFLASETQTSALFQLRLKLTGDCGAWVVSMTAIVSSHLQ